MYERRLAGFECLEAADQTNRRAIEKAHFQYLLRFDDL